jgi:hypothetical protein
MFAFLRKQRGNGGTRGAATDNDHIAFPMICHRKRYP